MVLRENHMLTAVWAQTLVLAFTAYLIWRYTSATEKYTSVTSDLRVETVRQNELSLRPIVLPEFLGNGADAAMRLRNSGAGCAVNVQVSPVGTLQFAGQEGGMGMGRIETRFEPIAYLPSGERLEVKSGVWADDQKLGNNPFHNWFHPTRPGDEIAIEIKFSDIEGRAYRLRALILAEHDLAKLPRSVRLGQIEKLNG
jgi:hypothetical protein